jgi:hypothetical protein
MSAGQVFTIDHSLLVIEIYILLPLHPSFPFAHNSNLLSITFCKGFGVLLTVIRNPLTLLFKIRFYFRLTKPHCMRKTILILLLSISAHNLYSQQDSLLKTFKYRINNYREIKLNIGGDGQLYNRELITGTYKSNSSSGSIGAAYYTLKSTDRILLKITGSVSSSFNSGKTENPTSNGKTRSFYALPQLSVLNKWFRKSMFTELGADIAGNYYTDKNTLTNYPGPQKNKRNDYSIAINMGIGKGRLENVTDMQNSLWLYKALQEEKRLSRSLSADELNELGRTITLANDTRVLDFRKRTQFVLETTDRFFQQKNILTANDIRYFSTLNDILFFAFNNPRLSGTEIYVRLTPAISKANGDQINNSQFVKDESRILNKSAFFSAGINKYIPANLRHQNNYGLSLKLNYISYHESNKYFISGSLIDQFKIKATIKQAGVNLFFQHVIYPDTRTNISFNLQSEMGYQDVKPERGFFGMADLSGSLNYFISYRTRLTCSLGSAWQKNIRGYGYFQQLELIPDNIHLYANAGLQVNL